MYDARASRIIKDCEAKRKPIINENEKATKYVIRKTLMIYHRLFILERKTVV